eukprot:s2028_g7.t1
MKEVTFSSVVFCFDTKQGKLGVAIKQGEEEYNPEGLFWQHMPAMHSGVVAMQGGTGPAGHWNPVPGANIFVYYIPADWTDDDFHQHFDKFGTIVSAKIHVDPVTKAASKGFGFCSYATKDGATRAIKGMNGFQTKQGTCLGVAIRQTEEQYNRQGVSAQNALAGVGVQGVGKYISTQELQSSVYNMTDGFDNLVPYLVEEDKKRAASIHRHIDGMWTAQHNLVLALQQQLHEAQHGAPRWMILAEHK